VGWKEEEEEKYQGGSESFDVPGGRAPRIPPPSLLLRFVSWLVRHVGQEERWRERWLGLDVLVARGGGAPTAKEKEGERIAPAFRRPAIGRRRARPSPYTIGDPATDASVEPGRSCDADVPSSSLVCLVGLTGDSTSRSFVRYLRVMP
jgi:hypothetical protein